MEDDKKKEKYLLILDAFRKMIYNIENSEESLNYFSDMVVYRASNLMSNVLDGLGIDFNTAMNLLMDKDIYRTEREELERDSLIAAFDNLIDFALALEYTMLQELPDTIELKDIDKYEAICQKYNERYAMEENGIVFHAGVVAAFWFSVSKEDYLTYNTQNDERVREWHQTLDGTTYKKADFPVELIPPIDWGCRCFLTTSTQNTGSTFAILKNIGSIFAKFKNIENVKCEHEHEHKHKPNPIFKESLATKGKIFSSEHPYFQHDIPQHFQEIATQLKKQVYVQ